MATATSPIHSLETTPTWAVATVFSLFISLSIAIDYCIRLLSKWLKRRRKHALHDAVERMKSELMIMGFIVFLFAGSQSPLSDLCVPPNIANTMLPCRKKAPSKNVQQADEAQAAFADPCSAKGKVSFITWKGMEQLQAFFFALAVMQIVYSFLTMAFGRAKTRKWKAWEQETKTTEYQISHDPERFRLARQTTFARRHASSCTETSLQLWTKCFFRQFFNPVAKVDYLTLRHGFISAHLAGRKMNFNFQDYIERSLDEDFKTVVGISPLMWLFVVIFMLLDVHGWHVFLWVSFIPLLIVLILGTKLEVIVAKMALQINNQNTVIRGTPVVQPNDQLFWFGRPRFVLTLVHLTLFVNAFELAFFIWVSVEFGLGSCYHEHTTIVIIRVVLPITVQVLCSYITLPLYALVTQMGSEIKGPLVGDPIAKIMEQWLADVREKRKKQELLASPTASLPVELSFRMAPSSLTAGERKDLSNRGELNEENDDGIVEVEASSSIN
ncbi:hypothetical protein V6N13_041467 [Hibiscus sabdariffa]